MSTWILKPLQCADGTWHKLSNIKHSLKSWTADQINRMLDRTGEFWQEEGFDRTVHGQKAFENASNYIWMDPVDAGLVGRPSQWRWWGKGSHRCKLSDRPPSKQK